MIEYIFKILLEQKRSDYFNLFMSNRNLVQFPKDSRNRVYLNPERTVAQWKPGTEDTETGSRTHFNLGRHLSFTLEAAVYR